MSASVSWTSTLSSNGGLTTTIAGGDIAVPARYWKVLLVLPFGEDDLTRINNTTRVIAVDMPNTQSAHALEWYDYRTSVDAIEDSTGLDLLNILPTDLQGLLEGGGCGVGGVGGGTSGGRSRQK